MPPLWNTGVRCGGGRYTIYDRVLTDNHNLVLLVSYRTQSAFAAVSFLMFAAAILQLSLLTTEDWDFVFGTHESVLRSNIITATTTTTSLTPTKRRSSVPSLAESVSIGDISTSDHDEEEDVEEEEEDWNRSTIVVDEVVQHQHNKLKTD